MKKFKCPDCEEVFEAETSKAMLDTMMPHYMAKHKEMMAGGNDDEKKAWMEKFNKDWEATKEE